MNKKEKKDFDVMQIILKSFSGCPRELQIAVVITVIVYIIIQFFAATNRYEIFVSLACFIAMMLLLYVKGTVWKIIRVGFAILLLVNLFATVICGAPFAGALSDENIQRYRLNKFHKTFAQALYEMSICEYDDALESFKGLENAVPKEYMMEYYLWYGETAMYAGKSDLSMKLLSRIENEDVANNDEQKKVVFSFLPICKMVNYLNEGEFAELRDTARQYQNTREQIFFLFELAALCLEDNLVDNQYRVEELIILYSECIDNMNYFSGIKKQLLSLSALGLLEDYPEYASILLTELYNESKSYFYETFFLVYPNENNFMNIRWTSLETISKIRETCEEGWEILLVTPNAKLKQYLPKVEQLSLYLGSEKVLMKKANIEEIAQNGYEQFVLYNVLPINNNEFLGVYIEKLSTEESLMDEYQIATNAHVCTFKSNGKKLLATPLMIDGQELTYDIFMNRLFLMEQTKREGVFLVESIVGTGEFLELAVLDLEKKTCKSIENMQDIYHASEFVFDGIDCFSVNFQIENAVDANMTTKVGGRLEAKIDDKGNMISDSVEYWDPALEFYAEERNDKLVFPLINLDRLNGKEIKSTALLEKIRENSIPYYQYSLIQSAYEYFMGSAGCQLSGITVIYDIGTEKEASFFYYVEKKDEKIRLVGIYEIVNGKLQSVY